MNDIEEAIRTQKPERPPAAGTGAGEERRRRQEGPEEVMALPMARGLHRAEIIALAGQGKR